MSRSAFSTGARAGRVLLAGAALAAPLALPLAAQDGSDAGGVLLRFDLSQSFEGIENADLDPDSEGRTLRADTRLGVALSSETRSQYLGLALSGALRYVDSPDPEEDIDLSFGLPRGALDYRLTGATSELTAGLGIDEQDVSYLRATGDLIDDDGNVIEDFDDLSGQGTRRATTGNVRLRFGIDTPTEGGVGVAARRVTYRDTDDPDLEDSWRRSVFGDLRLQVAPDMAVTGRLGYVQFDEDGEDLRETWEFDLGVAHDRPMGTARLDLAVREIEEGTSLRLAGSWDRALPEGEVGVTLGVAQSAEGTAGFVGGLRYVQDFDAARLATSLDQNLSSGTDDSEDVVTVFRASYLQDLTPVTALQLDMRLSDRNTLGNDDRTQRAEFGVGISHALTEDWALSAGYRRVLLDEDDADRAQSDRLFFNLGRSLSLRY